MKDVAGQDRGLALVTFKTKMYYYCFIIEDVFLLHFYISFKDVFHGCLIIFKDAFP